MARVESSRLIKIGPVSCAPVLSRLNKVNASNTAQNNPTEKRRWRDFDDAGIGATGNPDNVGSREVIYHKEIEEDHPQISQITQRSRAATKAKDPRIHTKAFVFRDNSCDLVDRCVPSTLCSNNKKFRHASQISEKRI